MRRTECRALANWFCDVSRHPEVLWSLCACSFRGKCVQMCVYTYIIYWTAGSSSILVFVAPLLSAYFRLDLLLTWLNEKILTRFDIALDIFSIIISGFIPCSSIVRVGLCSNTHTHTHTCVHIWTHLHTYVYTNKHTWMYVYMYLSLGDLNT